MRYCMNCGKAVEEETDHPLNFCPFCGAPMNGCVAPVAQADSDTGLISMILAIVSFFVLHIPLGIAALILSVKDKKRNGGVSAGYGKVGFICSIISLSLTALAVVLTILRVFLWALLFSM